MTAFPAGTGAPRAVRGGVVAVSPRSLAVAWAKDNIQVNTILPGWIDTDLTRSARAHVPGLNARVLARTTGVDKSMRGGVVARP